MPSSRRLMRYCERVRPKIHSLGALRIADQRETISCSGQRSMLRSSRALCALRRCAKLASSASCLAQEMNALGAMERCSRSMLGTSRRSYQRLASPCMAMRQSRRIAHRSVSPRAERTNEQPTATVFSAATWSSRAGFTSTMSIATSAPVSAMASQM